MRWVGSNKLDELLSIPKERILVLDTETTGLHTDTDEILQLSMVNGAGEVLFSSYIRPEHTSDWKEAAKINGITKEMVADAPTFSEVKEQVQHFFHHADLIVGYNVDFDLGFLKRDGIHMIRGSHTFDVMKEFFSFRTAADDSNGRRKWYKLTECAKFFDRNLDNAHDALADTNATLFCFTSLVYNDEYQSMVIELPIKSKPYATNHAAQDIDISVRMPEINLTDASKAKSKSKSNGVVLRRIIGWVLFGIGFVSANYFPSNAAIGLGVISLVIGLALVISVRKHIPDQCCPNCGKMFSSKACPVCGYKRKFRFNFFALAGILTSVVAAIMPNEIIGSIVAVVAIALGFIGLLFAYKGITRRVLPIIALVIGFMMLIGLSNRSVAPKEDTSVPVSTTVNTD